MAFKIMLATTTDLLDKAFQLRHQVFVEEEALLPPTADGRIIDRFDAYPTTHNLVVTDGDEVVGCFRLVLDSSEGVPADAYYDFRQHLPENYALMHTSLLCTAQQYRSPRLTTGLALMATYFAASHKMTHLVAPINPKIAKWLQRIGYKVVGKPFIEPHTGAPMLPLILDMQNLNDLFLHFIRQNQLQDFLRDYQRWFYQPGEMIIRAGDTGEEAFVVIEGTAEVRLADHDNAFDELHEGDIFGELALLTDEPRSADIVAKTCVQVMVLPKAVFMARFVNEPKQALNLLRMLGKRSQALLQKLKQSNM